MLRDRIEATWIDAFERVFALSEVRERDAVAILSESQSRQINVHLAELALLRLGAKPFHIVLPTPPQVAPVPIRSTGAAQVIGGLKPVVTALAASTMVVDITVEGMMHAPETRAILKGGSRILYISNEHPEALERLAPDEALKPKVERGIAKLKAATAMTVTSPPGDRPTHRPRRRALWRRLGLLRRAGTARPLAGRPVPRISGTRHGPGTPRPRPGR